MRELEELRKKSDAELLEEITEIKTEIRLLRTKIEAGGRVENPMRLRNLKKRLARALTVLRERKIESEISPRKQTD
ncbi:MAG: 50S ribosomal protein L29 [Thaumarchaeota archaeon]|nr:50S ribosomal protein L29 [Candidatus Calditenuaceae archaeon]MDW8186776.1 50S ribosomal protein L29 [Nitrososphaerota archaeon]